MGYQHVVFKATCGKCRSYTVYWEWNEWVYRSRNLEPWACKNCGAVNTPGEPEAWPKIPPTLYIGHDKNVRILKLYPIPPGWTEAPWARPYSIRSFVFQASRQMGGCWYSSSLCTEVMGAPVFSDLCHDPEGDVICGSKRDCHMVSGWIKGQQTCALWDRISQLCQTEPERRFLYQYLGIVKDRPFPMLIPQPRMGIGERRRPDFVLFVPRSYWQYRWYAVQLDKGHPPEKAKDDELRDAAISEHGYKVIRLKPEAAGYFEEVRSLVEKVDIEMKEAESEPLAVAKELPVAVTEPEMEDAPF